MCVAVGLMAACVYSAVTYNNNQVLTAKDGLQGFMSGNISADMVSNANGSHNTGSIVLWSPTGEVPTFNYKAFVSRVYLGASATTNHGIGNVDTGILVLKSRLGDRLFTVDSSFGAIPCSLVTAKISTLLDTLVKSDLILYYTLGDSSGDTTQTIQYPFNLNFTAKRLY